MTTPPILTLTQFGGMCPTEAHGEILGCPFYFRARHGEWTLTVAPKGEDPILHKDPLYFAEGEDHTEGYMPMEDFITVLAKPIAQAVAKIYGRITP